MYVLICTIMLLVAFSLQLVWNNRVRSDEGLKGGVLGSLYPKKTWLFRSFGVSGFLGSLLCFFNSLYLQLFIPWIGLMLALAAGSLMANSLLLLRNDFLKVEVCELGLWYCGRFSKYEELDWSQVGDGFKVNFPSTFMNFEVNVSERTAHLVHIKECLSAQK